MDGVEPIGAEVVLPFWMLCLFMLVQGAQIGCCVPCPSCRVMLCESMVQYGFGVLDERPNRPQRVIIIKGRAWLHMPAMCRVHQGENQFLLELTLVFEYP